MSDMNVIRGKDLDAALEKKYRLYLAGRLMMPQSEIDCIDDDIEVGISSYDEFTADKPHVHPIATEHCYVLEGSVRVMLLDDSREELELGKGDFFVLKPNSAYATKNKAGTKVLFIKAPGGNDKTSVEVDAALEKWLSQWDI